MVNPKRKKTKKEPSKIYARINGISLYGKFCTVLLTDTAIELHTTSAWLFILCAWMGVMIMMFLGILIGNYWVLAVLSVIGGIGGALLVWNLYTGKCVQTFEYKDIVSFVLDRADCTLNLNNNEMHTLRMMPKRQMKFMETFHDVLEKHTVYTLQKRSNYFRVEAKNSEKEN